MKNHWHLLVCIVWCFCHHNGWHGQMMDDGSGSVLVLLELKCLSVWVSEWLVRKSRVWVVSVWLCSVPPVPLPVWGWLGGWLSQNWHATIAITHRQLLYPPARTAKCFLFKIKRRTWSVHQMKFCLLSVHSRTDFVSSKSFLLTQCRIWSHGS